MMRQEIVAHAFAPRRERMLGDFDVGQSQPKDFRDGRIPSTSGIVSMSNTRMGVIVSYNTESLRTPFDAKNRLSRTSASC